MTRLCRICRPYAMLMDRPRGIPQSSLAPRPLDRLAALPPGIAKRSIGRLRLHGKEKRNRALRARRR